MITHLVMFKLKDPADAAAVKKTLDSLPPKIPAIRSMDVGINVVESPRAWDVGLIVTFDSLDDLAAYQSHPEHVEAAAFVKAAAASSASVDYEG